MSSYAPFKQLVHERLGLHLEGLHEARLIKAVEALRADTGEPQSEALIARLRQEPALFDAFISRLTVNETYFYREADALIWLAEHYLPERLAHTGAPLHILSAGCSSGEEPFSLAMALAERFGERAPTLFHITAGDVDRQALACARRGLYTGMAFRTLPEPLKARYFTRSGSRYAVDAALREWIDFRPLNVLDAPTMAESAAFDVILFRNVSIYFDEPTRKRIQQRLAERLAPGGVLLCGVAETLGNDLGVLTLAQQQGTFYFCRPEAAAAPGASSPPLEPAVVVPTLIQTPKAPPGDPPADAPPEPSSLLEQRLRQAHAHLEHSRLDEAESLLTALLEEQPWSVDALLLAGLVARWQQRSLDAQAYFKRALYVAPECWPAHFYQAELFRCGALSRVPGQPRRGYEATLRLLTASPEASGGLAYIRSPLPPGDACFLARCHLDASEGERSARRGA
ncbi:CheR family methyltransferase [Halomonas sp. HNIBRBA4712]|uniref:CheR family methyltransferase n=1 Tax=Halomonas sp. HNIBRBA4712 TaxID=3373087 RepID=UPI003746DFE9